MNRQRKSHGAAFWDDPTDQRHGTVNGYTNLRCRCDGCTGAWRVEHHRYMHADPARLRRHADRERARWAAKA